MAIQGKTVWYTRMDGCFVGVQHPWLLDIMGAADNHTHYIGMAENETAVEFVCQERNH